MLGAINLHKSTHTHTHTHRQRTTNRIAYTQVNLRNTNGDEWIGDYGFAKYDWLQINNEIYKKDDAQDAASRLLGDEMRTVAVFVVVVFISFGNCENIK